jgi:catechol 2,3-dioxygenase-like lactoylglutathione lyase family enzyme
MKRLHVHVAVENLAQSVGFYSTLFGSEPTVHKDDYAKWMLDDPRVNFAISQRSAVKPDLDHLGIQVENDPELRALSGQLKAAGETTRDQEDAACCYAKSNKSWVTAKRGALGNLFHLRRSGDVRRGRRTRRAGCRQEELLRARCHKLLLGDKPCEPTCRTVPTMSSFSAREIPPVPSSPKLC